ncbi:LacI family transcriptional regulator [Alicyclobacillus sacchari]|uniref:LacI family transcriptional regulator n=1 Tax=Alicyclobacillus sacchari TaxID=392010 RepID=A0A4R8LU72_9BACL|nr:LacI family DNA-binding transcriptional regulator [Alicyclobacillus sacchari]TDY50146.1 LacI family transcriptional regulator [Alicyclobacillus sacchari]
MEKRVTIQDVANRAGVSITTVSRYVNGRYESMSAKTRERIRAVIEELGYRPNALAQGLKASRTKSIAAVVVNMSYPFCVGFLRSLSLILTRSGYHLIVSETGGDADIERDVVQSLLAQRVEAMVLQTGGENGDLLAAIAEQMPVVLVDRAFAVAGAHTIATNNREASREMALHLFDRGYRHVIYVTEDEAGIPTRIERLQGYEDACAAREVAATVVHVNRQDVGSMERAAGVVSELAQAAKGEPIAVYTANGLIMMPLYRLLRQLPLAVPSVFGMATFDEPDWAQLVDPTLTCVRQPVEEMGAEAGRLLLKRVHGKPASDGRAEVARIVLPSHIVPGGSTK